MKKEDWTSELRNRLADFEEPAPEGLWEGIENKLPMTGSTQRKPVVLWRYSAAAAAILLLMIAGASLLWHNKENPVTTAKHIIKETHNAIVQQGQEADLIAQDKANQPALAYYPSKVSKKNTEVVATEEKTEETTINSNDITDNSTIKNEPPQETNKKKDDIIKEKPIREHNENTRIVNKKKSSNNNTRLTTGLYAYNPIGASRMSTSGVVASPNIVHAYSNASMAKCAPLYLHDYKEEAKHNHPVSLGLSLSYNLTDRIWLESGVVYTRVTSTFTHKIASRSLSDEQTLQYVGIPLRMGYTIWKDKRLSVYTIAGGEADINVKAEMETGGVTRDIEKDRMQWSANASVGVQYNFLPQFGVYAEPGIKYYIDNGSNIDNIFKDKKLDFSLQLGLRCLLNL